jgi:tRNA A-37 threonylcarbamoyl transferase component Bud32
LFEENKVAKVFHENISLSFINHELTISRKIEETDLRVPKVLGEQTIFGRKAIIYERIIGEPLTKQIEKQPWNVLSYIKIMGELQADIHQKTVSKLPFQKESLKEKIEIVNVLENEQKKFIIDCLDKLPEGNVLCHGDFHPNNLLFSKKVQ